MLLTLVLNKRLCYGYSLLPTVVRVEEKFSVGCTGPTSNDAGIEGVRDIYTHPSPSQLQKRFGLPCIFRSTGWGVQRLATGEIVGAMYLPHSSIVEAFP